MRSCHGNAARRRISLNYLYDEMALKTVFQHECDGEENTKARS